jgi:energy-coupling factor transporter ATP-binding protein EcfA2
MYSNINALRRDVGRRLRRGEHMVVYGPCGSGKSTLLADLEMRLTSAGVCCARATSTRGLQDITRALERAYPATLQASHPTSHVWLSRTADLQGGVLLLDHLTDVSAAMVRFLHGLCGTVGALSAVDTEVGEERPRMNPRRLSALAMCMPPVSATRLRELLEAQCAAVQVPVPGPDAEQQLVRAAHGRPGWILKCVELLAQGDYWQGPQLFVSAVSSDTENALRQSVLSMMTPNDSVDPSDDMVD